MRKFISFIFCIAIATGMILLLSGCVRTMYTEEQDQRVTENGRKMIEAYLDSLPVDNAELTYCGMVNGAAPGMPIYGGYYLSNLVFARFKAGDRQYSVIVDISDGSVWSDYYMFDLQREVHDLLVPYCEKYGYTGDFSVDKVSLYYRVVSHDVETSRKGELTDSVVCFDNMLPAEYCCEDDHERADSFLRNAPLEGFDIRYEIIDGNYMDPRILTDFLAESGNYLSEYEDMPERPNRDYNINGFLPENSGEKQNDGDRYICNWYMSMTLENQPSDMEISIIRRDRVRKDGFVFIYSAASASVTAADQDNIDWEEHDFPFELNDGVIRYYGDHYVYYPMLVFEEKPEFTEFTRVTYRDGKITDTVQLSVQEIGNGEWSLNSGRNSGSAYVFDREQDVEYK